MKINADQGILLELGFVLFAAGLSTGLLTLLLGRARGSQLRRRQTSAPPPESASDVSHGNIQTAAAR